MNSRERRRKEAEKFNAKLDADIAEKEAKAKMEQDIKSDALMTPRERQSRNSRRANMVLMSALCMAATLPENEGNKP